MSAGVPLRAPLPAPLDRHHDATVRGNTATAHTPLNAPASFTTQQAANRE